MHGLLAGGLSWIRLRARVVLAAGLLTLAACGNGEGKKRAVECQSTADCDASVLGICDVVECVENRCEVSTLPDGRRCDDSDPLTGEDACTDGICAGVVKTCEDDLGPCLKAVHDPETDECVVEPVENDTPCDDADACTQLDSCQAGECVGSQPKSCEATDDCHVEGTCDPETGECVEALAEDGAACDDGRACTTNDACTEGACGGQAVVCDDGLACSIDACDEKSGACAADMSACSCVTDQDCDDGNACNGQELCDPDSKLCGLGAAVVCAASLDACLKNVCVPETGACEPEPVVDGTTCDDADACTGKDTCQLGVCQGSDAVVCAALSQCHTPGVCDKITGACSHPEKPQNSPCNDANACTLTDTCQAGACVGTGQVSCSALDQCHDVGVCAVATGICSKPNKPNGVACDDANKCTTGDACQNGSCTPASQLTCKAMDNCHLAGTCDAATGTCSNPSKPNGTSCSDSLNCTSGDVCTGGQCKGASVTCDDKIACTKDSCSEQLGGCSADATACACKTSADCDDGNACNGVETCDLVGLTCVKGTPVDCSGSDDACHVGSCNPSTGACTAVAKDDDTPCDDGTLCTPSSSCQAGVCKGINPVICTALDACHDAGTCNPSTGLCSQPAKANGATCDDGNACTQTDTCQAGACKGGNAKVCAALDQCHAAGTCDPSSGNCSNPTKTNGSACNDADKCTQTDTCQGGVCQGASPVVCAASDQCHDAGTCNSVTGACSDPVKMDGSGCNDGDKCSQTDTCKSGVCVGANPIVCSADQCHVVGTCNSSTGVCSTPNKQDGTACDDSNACSKTDTCQAGKCTGGNFVTCSASDQCHDAGTCNTADGTCSNPNKPDNTPCGDNKACTSGDKCIKGVCGGTTITCDDKIACSVDSCVEPTGCNFDTSKCGCLKDADCVDADACNGVETCDLTTFTCRRGTAVNCSALDDACNTGTCDSKTGACKAAPKTDGTGCNDGNACTRSDGCVAGKCVGANPVTCSASDQCHAAGVCDKTTGACSNPNATDGTGCNDGNKCTQSDSCKTGVCVGASPVTCTASDQCHSAGTCDSATGVCTDPIRTGSCDDGNKCTLTDTCQSGVCKGANPVVCSAIDDCHDVGVCDSKTGVCTNPNLVDGSPCDDGNKCTQSDGCVAGKCTGTKPITCAALDLCHLVGTCDTKTGVCSDPVAPSTTKCNDGNACTVSEMCDGKGSCGGGGAVVCQQPADTCQTKICDSVAGCVDGPNQPNGTPCDDGSSCTRGDQCRKGICSGGSSRVNATGDWSDDPGAPTTEKVPTPIPTGPSSVDLFTDKTENVNAVGIYVGTIASNDKNVIPPAFARARGASQETSIYWAQYTEAGVALRLDNLGGVTKGGTLTVEHAASHSDGSFTVVGTILGNGLFGLNGKVVTFDATKGPYVYVAHYLDSGELDWLAHFEPQSASAFTVDSVASFDDGSLIVIGANSGTVRFFGKGGNAGVEFGPGALKPGIWAARLGPSGAGQWGMNVALRSGTAAAHAVTAHEDGGASLTGGFTGTLGLGPNGEIPVSVGVGEKGRDIWYEKLDKQGKISWGGRVGAAGADVPGDIAPVEGGGALLLVNTAGGTPNASDAVNTQQLMHATAAGLQAHVLSIDKSGVIYSDGLIANPETGVTHGWQLKRDSNGFYAVGGTFATGTSFWSKVGFGSGAPKGSADFSIASLQRQPGPATLFLARVNQDAVFDWAVQAGGDASGMTSPPVVDGQTTPVWDVVLCAHPSHSATLAGIFNQGSIFGDQVTETLQSWLAADGSLSNVGNPFIVHLNSQAQYDYCP
ncbi:MAG TPA: hypothetical protein VHP33_27850 [Polyangiaceae bacterium]|nr:hypothetical protein [Polyangiaceae bacterium]